MDLLIIKPLLIPILRIQFIPFTLLYIKADFHFQVLPSKGLVKFLTPFTDL